MNLDQARQVIVRTHHAAALSGYRANAIEMISGPGVGKSDTMAQSCADLAVLANEPVGYVPFMLATIASVDVRGFMIPVKNATTGILDTVFSTPPWYPTKANMRVYLPDGTIVPRGAWDAPLPRLGALALDEFAQAEDEVRKAAAELLLHGEVGTTGLPIGWRVLAASNRMSDRSGVLRALMFLTNRRMELKVDANLPAWLEWATAQPAAVRPHYLTLSFSQKNPGLVFRDAVPPGSDPFCTPRTLCLMDRDLMSLRTPAEIAQNKIPLDPIAREVCAGWIGSGEAAQYFSHARYADEIPDLAQVERDPMGAKLPANRDAQMVCGYFLAASVHDKNAANVMKYVERMGLEMQVLTVRAITKSPDAAKVRAISETPGFTSWLMKHKAVLIASRS